MQWAGLSQHLSARVITGTWLRSRTFSRSCRGQHHGSGECVSETGFIEQLDCRNFEKAGQSQTMNLDRDMGDKLSKAGFVDLSLTGDCSISQRGGKGETK